MASLMTCTLYIAPGKGSKKASTKDLKKTDVKKGSGKDKDIKVYKHLW